MTSTRRQFWEHLFILYLAQRSTSKFTVQVIRSSLIDFIPGRNKEELKRFVPKYFGFTREKLRRFFDANLLEETPMMSASDKKLWQAPLVYTNLYHHRLPAIQIYFNLNDKLLHYGFYDYFNVRFNPGCTERITREDVSPRTAAPWIATLNNDLEVTLSSIAKHLLISVGKYML